MKFIVKNNEYIIGLMFTGLIKDIGKIIAFETKEHDGDKGYEATIQTKLPKQDLILGASVSCGGMCLTVIDYHEKDVYDMNGHENDYTSFFTVFLSQETLKRTTAQRWKKGSMINLESSLRVGDMLGGHYVSGHIDGVARIVDIQSTQVGNKICVSFDKRYRQFIAEKGSITLDGISLTVNTVSQDVLTLVVIPHTQEATTWSNLQIGDEVNMEIDILARYTVNYQSIVEKE